ncbi:arf-GAP domain and FG repeat-containing protein 1-like [Clytia hemisphaerica]|uniref:Arf-GAP domain-containing protein n=1 Tax=Clytia hemisphaerica TaxID=252671 RepID=A0A7M5UCA8_9CNID
MAHRRADKMGPRRKQEDKHLKILRDLVTQPQNKKCFDCGQRGPTYVNMTIGAFVCTSCSGLLRGLNPPHRIKSISMASFTPQEMEFLQSHGNEVCRSTWLALWESSAAPEPDSREEQKVKDFLGKKYERKMWYSSKPKAKAQAAEPEAKPLKTLLGENSPQVIVGSKQEQKSASIKLPQSAAPTPQQPVLHQPEKKSNFDLLGDLSGDPFASSAPQPTASNSADAFGVFAQPPPAQNQQAQQAPLFDAFGTSSTAAPTTSQPTANASFDFFASSAGPVSTASSSATDFFAMSSNTSQQPAASSSAFGVTSDAGLSVGNNSGGDKYAAFADLGTSSTSIFESQSSSIFGSSSFGSAPVSSSTQSIFSNNNPMNNTQQQQSSNNIFGAQPTQQPFQQQGQMSNFSQPQVPQQAQQNPFMTSNNAPQQPAQPQKPLNPFQNFSASGGSTMSQAAQLDNFGSSMVNNQNNSWGTTASSANSQSFSSNNMFSTQFNAQTSNTGFSMQANQNASTQPVYSNNTNYTQPQQQPQTQQQQNFGGNIFQQQQQQQPISQNNMFGNSQQNAQQAFNAGQQSNGFSSQQSFGNFGAQQQQSAAPQKPFGGVQMPGFGQQPFPQQPQQQQPQQQNFGTWGQQQQAIPQQQQPAVKLSNNPFM